MEGRDGELNSRSICDKITWIMHSSYTVWTCALYDHLENINGRLASTKSFRHPARAARRHIANFGLRAAQVPDWRGEAEMVIWLSRLPLRHLLPYFASHDVS